MNRLRRIRRLEEQLRDNSELDSEMEHLWVEWCSLATEEEIRTCIEKITAGEIEEFLRDRSPYAPDKEPAREPP